MDAFLVSLVGALAAGAVVAAKDTATEVAKDAYAAIRQYIKDCYHKAEIDYLAEKPESKNRQAALVEDLQEGGAANDPLLPKLAQQLVAALKAEAPEAAKTAGVDLERIHAELNIQIRRVGSHGPVKISDVEARRGSVAIEDVGCQRKN